jgi:hypothetical protein
MARRMDAACGVQAGGSAADLKQVRVWHIEGTEAFYFAAVGSVRLVLGQKEEAIKVRAFKQRCHPRFVGQIHPALQVGSWQTGC